MQKQDERETKALMRDIANDTIDKTEWLKRSEVEKIKEATASHRLQVYIVDDLVERGFLEPEHLEYGVDYVQMRNAIFGALDYSKMMLHRTGDTTLGKSNVQLLYGTITRALDSTTQRAVFHAVENSGTVKHVAEASFYLNHFEQLAMQYEIALKALYEMLEGA